MEKRRVPETQLGVWGLIFDRSVIRRGLLFALGVGALLVTINHGDAILSGDLDRTRWLKIGLTVLVPYAVSTASSVLAARAANGAAAASSRRS